MPRAKLPSSTAPTSKAATPKASPRIRGKLWVESAGRAALTEAGADLLEQIEACGSLSQAAKNLKFAYRRAWMLIDAMNKNWPRPLVITATGGRRGGGTKVTEYGSRVLRTYRDLQLQLEHLIDSVSDAFEVG